MAKVSEILKTKSPFEGGQSLTDPKGIFQMLLWVVLGFFVLATGQNLARAISGKVSRIDTSPEPIFNAPAAIGGGDVIL